MSMQNLLADRSCAPCEGGVLPFSAEQARDHLTALKPVWKVNESGTAIEASYRFRDFYRVMSFVNALAHIANAEDHHPDLKIGYNYCHVLYTTHAIKGLSENDFICAAKIDRLS